MGRSCFSRWRLKATDCLFEFSDLFVCLAKLSTQVANLRVEILIPENGCYHADCNDHGHCKGGDRRDPPLQSSDDSKDAHDENNEHAKNNEADSPFLDRQFVLTHVWRWWWLDRLRKRLRPRFGQGPRATGFFPLPAPWFLGRSVLGGSRGSTFRAISKLSTQADYVARCGPQ